MGVVTGQDGSALRVAFGLDALMVASIVAYVAVTGGHGRRDDGFFADPVPDGLAVLALAAAICGGAVAAAALLREPPRTRAGRWALGLAIAFTVSFPVLGLITAVLRLDQGWAEPVAAPLQIAVALGAIVLGALAREPQRRGLLLIPLVIGASALMFFLTDLLFPY